MKLSYKVIFLLVSCNFILLCRSTLWTGTPEPAPGPFLSTVKVTLNGKVVEHYEYNVGETIELLCSCYTRETDIYLMWKVFNRKSINGSDVLIQSMGAIGKYTFTLKLTMRDFDRFTRVQCYVFKSKYNNILTSSGFIKFNSRSTNIARKPNIIGWTMLDKVKVENETCSNKETTFMEIKDNDAFDIGKNKTNFSICAVYFYAPNDRLERKLFNNNEDEFSSEEYGAHAPERNNYIYIGCGLLVVTLPIVVSYCLWRRSKRPNDESDIYSTPQVQYAELELTSNTSRKLACKEESPYAEIIGVMEPQR